MAKVKRGRKPKGEFSGKLSNFSTRIQPETRKALEHEAKVSGQSISQVAEQLMVSALADRRTGEFGRVKRAMSYLIAEIAHHIEGIHHSYEGTRYRTPFNWRSDPFFYEAFKIAVVKVLFFTRPAGGNQTSRPNGSPCRVERRPRLGESFKSPKARGEYVGGHILYSMRTIASWSAEERERQSRMLDKSSSLTTLREFYSLADAFRDLAPRPFERRSVELDGLNLFFWDPEQPKDKAND